MKVKSKSEVAHSCPILSDPMDCSPPGSSIHGIFQARVLEWGAIKVLLNPRLTMYFHGKLYFFLPTVMLGTQKPQLLTHSDTRYTAGIFGLVQ